jgi:hypothetical protein
MPVSGKRKRTVLTGQDGMITLRPPGTLICLRDYSDFMAGGMINVPASCDLRINDPVVFTKKGSAQLDDAIEDGVLYYIAARPTPSTAQISDSAGGAPIAFAGNGGSAGADTPGDGNYIEMGFALDQALCEVASVTLSIRRGEVDKTAIPCQPASGTGGPKMALFRSYQAGYADGKGVLTIRLTEDLEAFNVRLVQGVLFNNQSGAILKAYFNAVAATGALYADDSQSLYSELPIVLLGFNTRISPENGPTELAIDFRVSGQPLNAFGSGALTPPPAPVLAFCPLLTVAGLPSSMFVPIVTFPAGPVIELGVTGALEVAGVDATLFVAVVSFEAGPVIELGVTGALEVAAAL